MNVAVSETALHVYVFICNDDPNITFATRTSVLHLHAGCSRRASLVVTSYSYSMTVRISCRLSLATCYRAAHRREAATKAAGAPVGACGRLLGMPRWHRVIGPEREFLTMGRPHLSIYVRSDEHLKQLRSEADKSGASLSSYITAMALLGMAARRKGLFLGPDGKVYGPTETVGRSHTGATVARRSNPIASAPRSLPTDEDFARPPLPGGTCVAGRRILRLNRCLGHAAWTWFARFMSCDKKRRLRAEK